MHDLLEISTRLCVAKNTFAHCSAIEIAPRLEHIGSEAQPYCGEARRSGLHSITCELVRVDDVSTERAPDFRDCRFATADVAREPDAVQGFERRHVRTLTSAPAAPALECDVNRNGS